MTSDPFEALIQQKTILVREKQERLSRVSIVKGATMLTMHYEEPQYLWDQLLPDSGLCVMAASKAAGKTLFLLQLADAISKGREFLGVQTRPSKVLFLELELSQRRTAQRLLKMGIVPTDALHFAFQWQAGDEGIQTIADAIEEHGYHLVIVDVMQMLWPMDADSNSYQDTYSVLAPLRKLANETRAMILLVTHRRKAETADYLDGVIGSVGISANADVILTLQRTRGEHEAVLLCDGNDIESRKFALDFDPNPLGFSLSKRDPAEASQTPERRRILEFLRERDGAATTGEIAEGCGLALDNASHRLQKLVKEGFLMKLQYGTYTIRPRD